MAFFRQLPRSIRYARCFSTRSEPHLKTVLREVIIQKRELLREVKSQADKTVGEVRVENVLGGMRGLKSLIWEGSVLDANEGIRFHGHTIADCSQLLPKGNTGREILPEAMFWLLLTGRIPSEGQVRSFSEELASKNRLPSWLYQIVKSLPDGMHPMTQLSILTSALAHHSSFARLYAEGDMDKKDYWEATFDDSINLIAKLPRLATSIYRRSRMGPAMGDRLPPVAKVVRRDQDWAYNFATGMGFGGSDEKNVVVQDVLRLYLALHADHEGGNVSAHATHLVGSALSDPFLSYSAGLQGLAGPLHGLAAQEVLRFIQKMRSSITDPTSESEISAYLWKLLKSGQVIPGYGHAVLRKPDPRFTALIEFGLNRPEIANNDLFKLVKKTSEVAPGVLLEHGKTKNPHPNVDSASGVLFYALGLKEPLFYTVIFGVSRALGPLAQLIWDRALGLPIERPKSVDLKGLKALADQSG